MMCSCEEDFARRFFSHQIKYGVELNTQERIPVTLGFQNNTCNTCRGLPEEAHPMSESYGRTSKIRRYYWREILFETHKRFAGWYEQQGYTDWWTAQKNNKEKYDLIQKEVIEEIKKQHLKSPKYSYNEESEAEFIKKYNIEIVNIDGTASYTENKKALLYYKGNTYTVEKFSEIYFKEMGYKVLFTESIPFHVIFGTFMWLLIQDVDDPLIRPSGFGSREAFDKGLKGEMIWTIIPNDFGTSNYGIRRKNEINEHLNFLPDNKEELLWTFDYWIKHSADLREYLWAHREQDIKTAKIIINVLPVNTIKKILRYLVEDYWHRYCGWPDLLVFNEKEFFFAEVKYSKDKLSHDQKEWIKGNLRYLNLPFKLIKIHKKYIK